MAWPITAPTIMFAVNTLLTPHSEYNTRVISVGIAGIVVFKVYRSREAIARGVETGAIHRGVDAYHPRRPPMSRYDCVTKGCFGLRFGIDEFHFVSRLRVVYLL